MDDIIARAREIARVCPDSCTILPALADALEAERKARAQLEQELAKRRPVTSAGGSAWLVVRTREQMPAEVWGFRDEPGAEHEARAWFDAVGANWTETFLCQVVAGPGLPQGSVPLHPLVVEAVRLREELSTSRAAHEVTAVERDRATTELAMMRAWVEQARPVVEAIHSFLDCSHMHGVKFCEHWEAARRAAEAMRTPKG